MNVTAEHNLHSCFRLFHFLHSLLSYEVLMRLSFTGGAAEAAAPWTDFFSDVHTDVSRDRQNIWIHQFVYSFVQWYQVCHSEAEMCPCRINISYLCATDHWDLTVFYWTHRKCHRSSRARFPDPAPGSSSDNILSWPTASSSCCPTKHDTVCAKLTSCSRLMVIETVSVPESSAKTKARRTVPNGTSTKQPVHRCWQTSYPPSFHLIVCSWNRLLLQYSTPARRQYLTNVKQY